MSHATDTNNSTDEPEGSNAPLYLAEQFVSHTGVNVFLTGKAGTGKTTFLRQLREKSPKRMVVTAPTGVAAINAGGVTIHSFFQLPFGPLVVQERKTGEDPSNSPDMNKFSREKIDIIRSLDLLIIDEISMVRADLLDAVDRVLRRYKNRSRPFGGVQLLLIGDLQQLAPVVKEEEWSLLKERYETPYFFSSKALSQSEFVTIELRHIYRQQDERFITLLNQIRDNCLDRHGLDLLNSRFIPGYEPDPIEGCITLTTHNQQARRINEARLTELEAPSELFMAEVSGVFPEFSYPADARLLLKPGAQVMFARNDVSKEKRFYNGKIGTVTDINEGMVTVACADGDVVETEAVEWHNYTYTIDPETEEIRENLIGTFKQMPLRLAWAITIHKSQGLTFDKVVIDAGAAFAHGQVYVALSRCRTLEGMVLRSPVDARRLKTDQPIYDFMLSATSRQPDQQTLCQAKQLFGRNLLLELFDFHTLRHRLDTLARLLREHDDLLTGSPHAVCREAVDRFIPDVQDVARAFTRQIDRMLAASPEITRHAPLQERIRKGCTYFLDKLSVISHDLFRRFILECDNKAIRKSILEAIGKLEDEFRYKSACLEAAQDGFEVSVYLRARARASLGRTSQSKQILTSDVPVTGRMLDSDKAMQESDLEHPDLFRLLRDWRKAKAQQEDKAVYMVLPQQALLQVVATLPQNLIQLRRIKGIGDKKIGLYGKEILNIVADWCEANGIRPRLI